jgi:hypothetical protein
VIIITFFTKSNYCHKFQTKKTRPYTHIHSLQVQKSSQGLPFTDMQEQK